MVCPKAVIVYAGFLFSALTVLGWSANLFGSKVKALGFTLLLKGIMMASTAAWVTPIALTYLVLINAAASGCRLALRDTAAPGVDWSSNLARAIAAAAAATAARAKKPIRARHQRRMRSGATTPRLAVVARLLSLPPVARYFPDARYPGVLIAHAPLSERHVDLRRDQAAVKHALRPVHEGEDSHQPRRRVGDGGQSRIHRPPLVSPATTAVALVATAA
jgi:hypothetical protein